MSIRNTLYVKFLACLYIDELLIAHFVTSLFEQPQSLTQIVANSVRIASGRIGIWLGKDLWRNFVADCFEQFELSPSRKSGCCEFSALEIAVYALVLPDKDLLVH